MAKDVTGYATAEVTETMDAFADYLIAEVYGGELPEEMDEATFRKAVALGGSTRMYFQKSDFWKNDSRNYLANVEANREKKVREQAEKARESAKKAAERAKALEAKLADAVAAAKAKADALAANAESDEKAA